MKTFITLLSSVLLLITSSALAQDTVDKELAVSPTSRLSIDNMRGKLELLTSDSDTVRVVGTLDEDAEDFIFEQRGNTVYIEVKTPQNKGFSFSSSSFEGSDLKVYAPDSMDIDIKGVSMDLTAAGFTNDFDVRLVSGNIVIHNISGPAHLKTVSGDITAKNMSGNGSFETVSGDITDTDNKSTEGSYQAVSGDITVESNRLSEVTLQTVSGDINATLGVLNKTKMTTVSGDAQLIAELAESARVEAKSVSGDVDFGWRGDLHANFSIKSNAGGKIKNRLTDDKVEKAEWGPSSTLEFKVGNATSDVTATTVSGEITLSKE
jgi:DUF4097 and DUF4098 domain-containing protein YvlB